MGRAATGIRVFSHSANASAPPSTPRSTMGTYRVLAEREWVWSADAGAAEERVLKTVFNHAIEVEGDKTPTFVTPLCNKWIRATLAELKEAEWDAVFVEPRCPECQRLYESAT